MSTSRIIQLAQKISAQTAVLDSHLQSNGLPQPSFDEDGPTEAFKEGTPDVQQAKSDVLEAMIELRQLIEGPMNNLLPPVSRSAWQWVNVLASTSEMLSSRAVEQSFPTCSCLPVQTRIAGSCRLDHFIPRPC
jgi:hypothetical protein